MWMTKLHSADTLIRETGLFFREDLTVLAEWTRQYLRCCWYKMSRLPLTDKVWFLSKWGVETGEMWEPSWRETEDLMVKQHSVISFSVMVSGRDYPWLFLICSLSGNVFGQSSSSVRTSRFISIEKLQAGPVPGGICQTVYLFTCLDAVLLLVVLPWCLRMLLTWTGLLWLHTGIRICLPLAFFMPLLGAQPASSVHHPVVPWA